MKCPNKACDSSGNKNPNLKTHRSLSSCPNNKRNSSISNKTIDIKGSNNELVQPVEKIKELELDLRKCQQDLRKSENLRNLVADNEDLEFDKQR